VLKNTQVTLDERIAVGWGIRGFEPPASVEELTEQTVKLGEAARSEADLPTIGKPFELPELPAFDPPCRFPFLVSPAMALREAEAAERGAAEGRQNGWQEVVFDTYYFDMSPHLGGRGTEVVFLSTHFRVEEPRKLKLFPASTDGITLWFDGESILSYVGPKPFLPAPHRPGSPLAEVQVDAGWHRVLLQVVARSVSSEFSWIVADEENHHVTDLEYSARI
jgi:hypothetical protein